MQKKDGIFYAPVSTGEKITVVREGEFLFSVIGLDHGHIYAITNGLLEAGSTLEYVYDDDEAKVDAFIATYPMAKKASSMKEVFESKSTLIASAIRPDKRARLALQVMESGKDVFVDKPGFLKLSDLDEIKGTIDRTGRKFMVYFGERVHVEGAVLAQRLIDEGTLGEIVSIQILAPHRLNPPSRPDWFWKPELNGGILADIGSHQLEQFLSYAHAKTARITSSVVGNYNNPEHPEFQDFGQVTLITDNNVVGSCRLDWFTPDGLGAWGDGRAFIVGTKASLEIRKYINVATSSKGDQLYLVDAEGEHHIDAYGMTGFPFFGQFILDCINRTENSITQEHVLESMRLTLVSQRDAEFIRRG